MFFARVGACKKEPMEIKFINADTLNIKTKEVNILLDPSMDDLKSSKSDIAITTTDKFNISKSDILKFDWPGEYEAKNVLVKSIATENKEKQEVRIVTMEINGVNTAYIGAIDSVPSNKKLFEELSIVEVLILNSNLNSKQTLEIIEEIEPKVVVLADNKSNVDESGESVFDKVRKEIGKQEDEIQEKVVVKADPEALETQIEYLFISI
jgi:hypothetical protein